MVEKQGASSITLIKEAQIYGVVKTRLTQRKLADYIGRIHVYDIFSGDGINFVEGETVWGSPIEIINAIKDSHIAERKSILFTASDIRQDAVDRLVNRINGDYGFQINCKVMDAASQIKEISLVLNSNKKDHAIVIVDPNGPGVLPFEEMLNLSRKFNRRADIFLNISETAMNRILRCGVTKDKNWWASFDNFTEIICEVKENYRQAWVRRAIKGDRQKWRFLCFWTYAPTQRGWEKQGIKAVMTRKELELILMEGAEND